MQLSGTPVLELRQGIQEGKTLLGWSPGEPNTTSLDPSVVTPPAQPVWLENASAHSLCIAPTGGGKGRSSLIPQLLDYSGSAVVVDTKGEAAMVTGRYRSEVLGQRVIYLDPFHILEGEADTFNPFDVRAVIGERIEDFAMTVPQMIHPGYVASSREAYWDNQGDQVIAAASCGILASQALPTRNLNSVADLVFADDAVYDMAKFLDAHGKEIPKFSHKGIASFIGTTEVTRSGILSNAQQHLKLFATATVREAFAKTSFDLEAFRRGEPTTIYLVLPPQKLQSHAAVLRIWLTALLRLLMSRTEQSALPTTFFVDELAQLGHLSEVETAFTLMRGYGVRISVYLQDLQQLKQLYPESWQTLLGNAGLIQVLRPHTRIAAKQLAKLFPKEISMDDILRLADDEQLLLSPGGRYQRTQKLDYLTDACYEGRFDANRFYPPQRPSAN